MLVILTRCFCVISCQNTPFFSAFDKMSNFDHNTSYTRSDVKTNSFTLIDGILLSNSLAPLVTDVRIINAGDNVSDHLPVEIDIKVALSVINLSSKKVLPYVNSSKLS